VNRYPYVNIKIEGYLKLPRHSLKNPCQSIWPSMCALYECFECLYVSAAYVLLDKNNL